MPELKYEDRMKKYVDSTFLPSTFEIHWLSIINSFVLVMLLTAFLTIILMRILKKDFSRYMEVDEVMAIAPIVCHSFTLFQVIFLFWILF